MALKELVEKLKAKGWIVYCPVPADINKIKEHKRGESNGKNKDT